MKKSDKRSDKKSDASRCMKIHKKKDNRNT